MALSIIILLSNQKQAETNTKRYNSMSRYHAHFHLYWWLSWKRDTEKGVAHVVTKL